MIGAVRYSGIDWQIQFRPNNPIPAQAGSSHHIRRLLDLRCRTVRQPRVDRRYRKCSWADRRVCVDIVDNHNFEQSYHT